MAEIIEQNNGRKKKPLYRQKRYSAHIDMTPMVDLACLLITFFMLTTAFSKQKIMEIVLPDPQANQTSPIEFSKERTYHLLIEGNDRIYWYKGKPDNKTEPVLTKIDYSKDGLRKLLLEKNSGLAKKIDDLNQQVFTGKLLVTQDKLNEMIRELKKSDQTGPLILIKASKKAKYRNLVDVIDEMAICNIARYAIVEMLPSEEKMLLASK